MTISPVERSDSINSHSPSGKANSKVRKPSLYVHVTDCIEGAFGRAPKSPVFLGGRSMTIGFLIGFVGVSAAAEPPHTADKLAVKTVRYK